jgi:hypothetical protein
MNEIEKICKEIQCPHFIVWSFGYGNCIIGYALPLMAQVD